MFAESIRVFLVFSMVRINSKGEIVHDEERGFILNFIFGVYNFFVLYFLTLFQMSDNFYPKKSGSRDRPSRPPPKPGAPGGKRGFTKFNNDEDTQSSGAPGCPPMGG
ncbi:hypothetical protein RF11_04756 [Thelohanellus kitauei]|uniref:Selenoprotein K n=1 Tax=Thelohanellus kitauei TaxID=669202 RepID=A0A0C2N483_THEKT|nr:hypothetical protein RF11_04756 [Thelohanellus kitauei]